MELARNDGIIQRHEKGDQEVGSRVHALEFRELLALLAQRLSDEPHLALQALRHEQVLGAEGLGVQVLQNQAQLLGHGIALRPLTHQAPAHVEGGESPERIGLLCEHF